MYSGLDTENQSLPMGTEKKNPNQQINLKVDRGFSDKLGCLTAGHVTGNCWTFFNVIQVSHCATFILMVLHHEEKVKLYISGCSG